ncbi:MAG: sugar dehydrogenase [Actinobacteria bacterium]|nr:sugar dehydrogenase [Actinomycetota bacterium]
MSSSQVAGDLSFPTSVAISDSGEVYVGESGLPFAGATPGGRVWHLAGDGERTLVASGLAPPLNGLTWHDGALFASEGGAGRISRITLDGVVSPVIEGLPGPGDYHVNMVAFAPDGKLYFSQGSMTNLAIVGLDALELGWLRRIPDAHDIPGYDVVLAGTNVETDDPRTPGRRVTTGAFKPFGTPTLAGEAVPAGLPCTAAVMRCNADGTQLELVAWGLRNAFGLAFLDDGRLLALDQGADERGSRPIGGAPDLLFEVQEGSWYGWPDYVGGRPVTDETYRPERGPAPTFVLADHDGLPPPAEPLVRFPPHCSATKLCVLPASAPWPGQLVVTLFGDEAPMTAPSGRAGRSLVRVDASDWSLHPLAAPSLHRPIDVAWHRRDAVLLVVDFGRFEMTSRGVVAEAGSGSVHRIPLEER